MFLNQPDTIQIEESFGAMKISVIASMTIMGVSYGIIFLLWFFMLSDTILGVWKSVTLDGWSSVTRSKLLHGLGTKMAIIFIPLSIAVTGFFAGYDLTIFVNTAMWALIANDAASSYTNILSIKKKKNYINKDIIELLINTLRDLIYNGIKSALNKLSTNEVCDFNEEDTKNSRGKAGRDFRTDDSKSNSDTL